jgi:transcriptional regulator with XRE-family HTH domain
MRKSVHSRQYQVFLECLVAARKAAGMTQQDLADRLKRPQSFVAKYENGERRLDVVEFLQIAKVLKADPHDILAKLQGMN